MKLTILFAVALTAFLSAALPAFAQEPAPPPGYYPQLQSAAELDQMLAPIALYPDPLIAQILPAATLPSEVVLADRYANGGGDPNLIDQQTWDPSLQALARYPAVLKWMDDNLAWTTALGQAFLNQPADVMDSIQRLRAQAQALGNLQTTPQQQVIADDGFIEIVPADPEVIYVPVYQPGFIFWQSGYFLSFGAGFRIGLWLNHDCDWYNHNVIFWHRNYPRPRDWWYHPVNPRSLPVTVSQNVAVWRPRNRPAVTAGNRSDRGWEVRGNQPAVSNEARPAPAETRPMPVRVEPRPVSVPVTVPVSRPAAPAPRPSGGALIGIENARDTREFSNRGGQSRQTISQPAPAPRPSAPVPSRGSSSPAPGKR
jgi:hypothetical protein